MARKSRPVVTLVSALTLLFGATALLASFHDRVRAARTRSHLDRGRALAAQQPAAAVEQYRAALSLERDDPQARRALALTLLSLGRLGEAESYIRDLLKEDPADGPLNRALARIHAARGRSMDAHGAYQRAVYGEWPDGAAAERIATRFELIEYLGGLNAREEVLAELLRLKAELPAGDTAAARRAADLLASSGALNLAAQTLRSAATAAPRDIELLRQLSDVETALGRYADARATLRAALAIDKEDRRLATRLATLDRVLELDPTLPGLRLVTRTRRARLLLTAVLEHTQACAPADSAAAAARGAAADRLRRAPRADAEAAEQELSLASELWAAATACHDGSPEGQALAQILQRVAPSSESRP